MRTQLLESLVAGLLAVIIWAGSLFLWIGVPVGGLWLAGEVTEDRRDVPVRGARRHPLAMIAVGLVLYRVHGVYERIRPGGRSSPARPAWLNAATEERPSLRRLRDGRSLLDIAMAVSVVTALVLLLVWFFFLAEQIPVSRALMRNSWLAASRRAHEADDPVQLLLVAVLVRRRPTASAAAWRTGASPLRCSSPWRSPRWCSGRPASLRGRQARR